MTRTSNDPQERTTMPQWRHRIAALLLACAAPFLAAPAAMAQGAADNTIQSITAQTSQGASQTAQSIGNLAQLAADLRRSVADFKLPA